ncbi:MAG: efflux RND transporter periplasmic adaptor subunit [Acidobacteria bacterium]|nr:efflux RND transporter periplasmic adaptor subunit [Acidobacteriota bacterium]
MKRTSFVAAGVVVLIVLGAYAMHRPARPARFLTTRVTAGDVARTVIATGTLNAIETVNVGSQVSGIISELDVDYNSVVHEGEVLARLDPALVQAQVDEAGSKLAEAQDAVEAAGVSVEDARVKLGQADALAKKELLTESDLEDAQVTYKQAVADLNSKKAGVVEAQAELDQARVDLTNSTITSPIDGIVIARDVDAGQTVAARLSAPTLFEIAADLTHLQLDATIDESDVGALRAGQGVAFTVEAYPARSYSGVIKQVRLGPDSDRTAPAAVTYTTVIDVANPDLSLRPGMTATLTIETARHANTLRVTRTALEWLPTLARFKELNSAVPPEYADAARVRTGTVPGSTGYLWYEEGPGIRAIKVATGLTDGAFVEVSAPGLSAGKAVITSESVQH